MPRILLIFSRLLVVVAFELVFVGMAGAAPTSVEQLVKEEFASMKQARQGDDALQDCQLIITKSSLSHAFQKSIYVNPDQLAKYMSGISVNAQRGFCRFVIAHEMGHIIHYAVYKKDISSFQGEYALFLEGQADILGAYLLGQLLCSDYFTKTPPAKLAENNTAYIAKFAGEYLDGFFDQIINMGDEDANLTGRTHPLPEQRALAAKKGLVMGVVQFIQTMPVVFAAQGQYIPREQVAKVDSFVRQYAKSIGYAPGSNYLTWSHETAQRIVHMPRQNCPDIVVEELEIAWDTSKPPVRYALRVKNRGEKPLKISFDVSVILCDRKEPTNITLWDFVATDSYNNVDLDKGQSQDFYGTLHWEATASRMPRVIMPSQLGGTYTVFAVENSHFDSVASPVFISRATLVNGKINPAEVADFVTEILSRRDDGDYAHQLMGIGSTSAQQPFVYYPSPYRCAATTAPIFMERAGKISLEFDLVGLYHQAEAQQLLAQLGQAIKASFLDKTVEIDEDKAGFWLSDEKGKNELRVKMEEPDQGLARIRFYIPAK